MRAQDNLDPAILAKLLRYEPTTGRLFWRRRPVAMFPDDGRPARARANTWNKQFAGRETFVAVKNGGYRCGHIFNRQFYAHRVIYALMTGAWPEHEIDHINRDRSDNRWSNLRPAQRHENMQNLTLAPDRLTGVVQCRSSRARWRAFIKHKGVNHYLGGFDSPEEAAEAYRAAKARLHTFNPEVRP